MQNSVGDVALTNISRGNKILRTKLYMRNNTGDVALTNIRRETNY